MLLLDVQVFILKSIYKRKHAYGDKWWNHIDFINFLKCLNNFRFISQAIEVFHLNIALILQ